MIWRVALIAVAAAAAFAPIPAAAIERYYSNGAYPLLQPILTGLSNAVPFALFDLLLLGTLVGWLWLLARDAARYGRRRWFRIAVRLGVRTLLVTSAAYVAFVAAWGLNYRRVPLVEKLEFSPAAVSAESARRLAFQSAEAMNGLHRLAHVVVPRDGTARDELVDPTLSRALAGAEEALGDAPHAELARPKRTLLDLYFRSAAVEGMTAPFFIETLVASDLLPVELPFVVAHEWSHLAGFADEGEANFVGWLTCLRGSERAQYSGWLFLYLEVERTLPDRDRSAVAGRLDAGPREDLQAIAERRRRNVVPMVATAGWRVYDRYLKANHVEAGAASYGEVLRLVLGTRFGPGWTPALKRHRPGSFGEG